MKVKLCDTLLNDESTQIHAHLYLFNPLTRLWETGPRVHAE